MHIGPLGGPELVVLTLFPIAVIVIIVGSILSANKREAQEAPIPREQLGEPLKSWKTSIGFSILGLVVYAIVYFRCVQYISFFSDLPTTQLKGQFCGGVVLMADSILCLVYALYVRKSFFGETPRLKSSKAISFWNFFFGGIIFGCIWNNNLTHCSKGTLARKNTLTWLFVVSCILGLLASGITIWQASSWGQRYTARSSSSYSQSYNTNSTGNSPTNESSSADTESPNLKVFKDKKFGVRMTIPDGWDGEDVRKNKKYGSVRLIAIPNDGSANSMMYLALKADSPWPKIYSVNARTVKRAFSSSFEDCKHVKVKKVNRSRIRYWSIRGIYETSVETTNGDKQYPAYREEVVHWKGRRVYCFCFDYIGKKDPRDTADYQDFEQFVRSVEYE